MRTIFNCPGSSIPTLGLKSVIVTLEFQTTAILDTSNPMAGQLTKIGKWPEEKFKRSFS